MNKQETEKCYREYEKGLSGEEVAKLFPKYSRRCITNNFKKYGFKMRKSGTKGIKNHNWKGGITKFRKIFRKTNEYNIWRLKVFERDDFTCQKCKLQDKSLNAHHIITKKQIFEKYKIDSVEKALKCEILFDVNNGITYCKKCHTDIHRIKRKIMFK